MTARLSRWRPSPAEGVAIVLACVLTAFGLVAVAATQPTGPSAAHRYHAVAASTTAAGKAPTPSAAPSPTRWLMVSVGDSVPAGSYCDCAAFPAVYARQVSARTQLPVTVRNDGVPGLTSGQLADTLRASASLRRELAGADIVTVTIGANDFSFASYQSGRCGGLSCYAPGLTRLGRNLDESFGLISQLLGGRRAAVRVTGYWEIWRDGAVGRRSGTRYMQVDDALTRRVNTVIAERAAAHGMTYVDLYRAFHGPRGDRDDTPLLAADGDHPSRVGHELIASALLATGLAPLLF